MGTEKFSDWLKKHARRPILKVVGLALGLQFSYFCFLAYERYSEQLEKTDQLRESVSIGVQQSNRPLIESAILSFLSNPDVTAVLLCSGNEAQMAYPPDSRDYCRRHGGDIRRWPLRREIIGISGITLLVILNPVSILNPMLFWLLVSAVMTLAIFWLLVRMSRRFETEILTPIMDGLGANATLAIKELEQLRSQNIERSKLLEERVRMDAIVSLSTQVAHDIRSPLAALDSALKDLSSLPAEQQTLARGAMGRIGEIARDLLENYKKPGARAASTENPAAPHDLKSLIEPVLAEKRAQYAFRPGISIEFAAEDVRAEVQPAELRRIVSNLVNNAVEAFEKGGRVEISLSRLDGRVLLKVADDGKGVPPELLAKLGQKGETHGKTGGTGLGLYHARTTVEAWGGTLRIDSEPGKGTAVTLELPAVPVVKPAPKAAVLLDDDALVHMNWKMSAKAAGVELKPFKSPEELLAAAAAIPKDTPFFIDSDLGDGAKGEDVAVRLRGLGFTDLTMATGHSPEKFSHLPWLKVAGKEPPWA